MTKFIEEITRGPRQQKEYYIQNLGLKALLTFYFSAYHVMRHEVFYENIKPSLQFRIITNF
jgi:hypothetical protein